MSDRPWYSSRRLAVRAALLLAAGWAALVALGFARGGTWPTTAREWYDYLTLALIVSFLALKPALMTLRMRDWGRLGASLVAANLAFCSLYLYAIVARMWPVVTLHRADVGGWHFGWVEPIRWAILLTAAWGMWELARVPDPDPDDDGSDAYLWDLIEAKDRELDGLRAELARLRPKGETPL